MEVQIQYRPSYSLAVARLAPNETIQVEAGSMVGMSAGMTLETKARGGILKRLARSMLGGESFFVNTYHAPAQGGEIMLAPALPGDMIVRQMQGETLLVQSGSYVASGDGAVIHDRRP
ncbi:MAG: TIGR00266 family protein [Chloroflexi bacterium]|nr:TIGR00266 family protein [Chloroflexota bacterium]